MYGTILFWIASVVMIFCYTSNNSATPNVWPIMWHVGAIMTCIGGYWFWLFLRVDVLAEADGSRDNLPPPADVPEQFGLGIKREEPKHY